MTSLIGYTLDGIVVRYFAIAGSLLLMAGLALAGCRWGLRRPLPSVERTYHSWWLMLPLALAFVAPGRTAIIAGVTLLSLACFGEFARATGLYRDWWLVAGVTAGILAVAASCWVKDPRQGTAGWYGLFSALPAYGAALLLAVPVVRGKSRGQLQRVSLSIVGFLYFGWMLGHLSFLANAEGARGYLLFLLLAVVLTDVAGFTCGKVLSRVFGRYPLAPKISPNKTWAGFLGALAVAMALPWCLSFSFPECFGTVPKLLLGLVIGLGGQLGDLTISFIKRDLGIKDMGTAIPGHGGVLDRCDSLVYVAPLFFHLVRWYCGVG